MQKLNNQIIKLVTKYPFLTDPIVLFNPSEKPSKKDILSGKLKLKYPEIDKNLKKLEKIKKDFFKVNSLFIKSQFRTKYFEVEVQERLKDFYKVIKIIELFYEKEEFEKYNLINEYYWIDFELLEEIFENEQILKEWFINKTPLISAKEIKKLEKKELNAKEVKYYFKKALVKNDLDENWNVTIGDVISVVHTNFNKNWWDIIIPKKYTTTAKKMLELIAHEIDWHCIQFTNCDCLSSGTVRYSQSESLVEWFAIYTEYHFADIVYWEKSKLINLINKNRERFLILNKEQSIDNIFETIKWNKFRFFRWFRNIKKYMNLKDFVYIQWLYKIIIFSKIYANTFSLLRNWAINDSFINKYWIKWGRKEKLNIKKTSAYYILTKYLLKDD